MRFYLFSSDQIIKCIKSTFLGNNIKLSHYQFQNLKSLIKSYFLFKNLPILQFKPSQPFQKQSFVKTPCFFISLTFDNIV